MSGEVLCLILCRRPKLPTIIELRRVRKMPTLAFRRRGGGAGTEQTRGAGIIYTLLFRQLTRFDRRSFRFFFFSKIKKIDLWVHYKRYWLLQYRMYWVFNFFVFRVLLTKPIWIWFEVIGNSFKKFFVLFLFFFNLRLRTKVMTTSFNYFTIYWLVKVSRTISTDIILLW